MISLFGMPVRLGVGSLSFFAIIKFLSRPCCVGICRILGSESFGVHLALGRMRQELESRMQYCNNFPYWVAASFSAIPAIGDELNTRRSN